MVSTTTSMLPRLASDIIRRRQDQRPAALFIAHGLLHSAVDDLPPVRCNACYGLRPSKRLRITTSSTQPRLQAKEAEKSGKPVLI